MIENSPTATMDAAPAPSVPANPVMVQVLRGDTVESAHRGAAAVVDASGAVVAAWGDIDRPVYPRSAIKPLQALALVESGAAEAFAVTDEELALACASHSAEPAHVTLAAGWLARLGLGPQDLECGAHAPLGDQAAEALIATGQTPLTLHNNCSGKHTAMLATARHMGEPTQGYVNASHPVQTRIRAILGELTGVDLDAAPVGIDGCSIPTYGLPLRALAGAMARFAAPNTLPHRRGEAARRVARALAAHPFMVSGSGRFDTQMISRSGGAALVKGGAEGVHTGAVPGYGAHGGLGIALKIDDGAKRASEVAIAAILRYLEILDDAAWLRLETIARPRLKNRRGIETGVITVAPGWLPHG